MKEVSEALAKYLKYPILIFGIALITVVMTNIGNLSKEYQGYALGGGFFLVLLALGIYLAERMDNILPTDSLETPISEINEEQNIIPNTANIPIAPIVILPALPNINNEQLAELRIKYLSSIVADCKRARLAGLDPKDADPTKGAFSLEHLYISLDTRTPFMVKEESGKQVEKPLSAIEALMQSHERCIVLLGLPGSGKSTFVRFLALQNARVLLDANLTTTQEIPGWIGKPLLPVIIPLGRLAESLPLDIQRGNADLIENFIRQNVQINHSDTLYENYFFKDAIDEGAVFLFDGLDEVADLNKRPIIVEAVEDFASRYRKNALTRFLVTCRTFSYTDLRWQLLNWATFELGPLSEEKIYQFIDENFHQLPFTGGR